MKKTGKMLYLRMISNVVAEAVHKMINILTKIDEFDIELLKQVDFLRFTLNRQSSCSWLEVSHLGVCVGGHTRHFPMPQSFGTPEIHLSLRP